MMSKAVVENAGGPDGVLFLLEHSSWHLLIPLGHHPWNKVLGELYQVELCYVAEGEGLGGQLKCVGIFLGRIHKSYTLDCFLSWARIKSNSLSTKSPVKYLCCPLSHNVFKLHTENNLKVRFI